MDVPLEQDNDDILHFTENCGKYRCHLNQTSGEME